MLIMCQARPKITNPGVIVLFHQTTYVLQSILVEIFRGFKFLSFCCCCCSNANHLFLGLERWLHRVKTTGCSFRASGFDSRHPCLAPQSHQQLQFQRIRRRLLTLQALPTCIQTHTSKPSHTQNIIRKNSNTPKHLLPWKINREYI